jgi:hypothetical protein
MWFLAEVGEGILDEQCMCPVPTEERDYFFFVGARNGCLRAASRAWLLAGIREGEKGKGRHLSLSLSSSVLALHEFLGRVEGAAVMRLKDRKTLHRHRHG